MTEASAEPFRTSISRRSLITNASRHHPENTTLTRTIARLTAQIKTLTEEIHGQVIREETTDGARDK